MAAGPRGYYSTRVKVRNLAETRRFPSTVQKRAVLDRMHSRHIRYGDRVRTIKFIGVSTAGSSIHQVFPRWARLLGVDAEVVGVDVPRGPDAHARLRDALSAIRADERCLGAVVTSWKSALYQVTATDFDELDELAAECHEVNAVRRHEDGRLSGYARDPISVGRVVDGIWPERDADLLCLGSGGTAIALGRHLLARGQRGRLQFIDREPAQTSHFTEVMRTVMRTVMGSVAGEGALNVDGTVCIEAKAVDGPYDDLVAGARPGTLIVNATGAGKDRAGSPVTDNVEFPRESVFWDLNYRGELGMLAAARRQADDQDLRVHDGLSLFCHGWAAALSAVLGLPDDPGLADAFAAELPRAGSR